MKRRSRYKRDLLVGYLEHLKATEDDPDERNIERSHYDADSALIEFIGDPAVEAAYEALNKHYY